MHLTPGLNRFVTEHPVMVSALGLSPLVARSETLLTAFVMGLAFVITLLSCSAAVGALRRFIPWSCHLIFILLITATSVTILERLMQAWLFDIRAALGIYVSLIAVNTLLLATLEETSLRRSFAEGMKKAAATGLAVFMLVISTGLIRELLGRGGVLTDTAGPGFVIIDGGLPLAGTAAGVFLILGCVIAFARFCSVNADTARVEQSRAP